MSGEVVLRSPGPGDLGWIVERHGALYAAEYDWGLPFEALVAAVIAEFAAAADDPRLAAWIAELDGERAGAVLCVREDESVAKLRLLLVEPAARGHGIGGLLVRGMHPLRAVIRIPASFGPLDQRRPHPCPAHLRGGGLRAGRRQAPSDVRPRGRRPELGASS